MGSLEEMAAVRLHRGPQPHTRERVIEIQRDRLLAAMARVAAEGGYKTVAVREVIHTAGVSRRTFYEHFNDREECFHATLAWCLNHTGTLMLQAYDRESSWRKQIRAAMAALLGALENERWLARVLFVESLTAPPNILALRQQALQTLADRLEDNAPPTRPWVPTLRGECTIGGVLSLIHPHVLTQDRHAKTKTPLTDLLNPLMSVIVLPYLGPAAAQKENYQPTRRYKQYAQSP
jgi:AcrR family transcriptional regulator